jgi:hypothetical protein
MSTPCSPIIVAYTGAPTAAFMGVGELWAQRLTAIRNELSKYGYTTTFGHGHHVAPDQMATVCVDRRTLGVAGDGCVTFFDPDSKHSFDDIIFQVFDIITDNIALMHIPLELLPRLAPRVAFAIHYGDLSADALSLQFIDLHEDEPEGEVIYNHVNLGNDPDAGIDNFKWVRPYFEHVVLPRSELALAEAVSAGVKILHVSANADEVTIVANTVDRIVEGIAALALRPHGSEV